MTDHPTTSARDLYAAILREPWDDAHRLVYADYLDEHPRDDNDRVRAEFIRLQIAFSADRSLDLSRRLSSLIDALQVPAKMLGIGPDWSWSGDCESAVVTPNDGKGIVYTFRRGFVDSVAMTMQAFVGGGECRNCGGAGDVLHPTHYRQPCKECGDGKTNGSGRTPGLASVICARWPVREIRLTGKEPRHLAGRWGWLFYGDYPEGTPGNVDMQSRLPVELMRNGLSVDIGKALSAIYFPTREAAMLASSHAAVAHARELAGLPALNFPRIGSDDGFRPERERVEQFQ